MNFALESSLSFIIVFAGLSSLFLQRANFLNVVLLVAIFILFTIFSFYFVKKLKDTPFLNAVKITLAVISSAFSLYFAANVAIESGLLQKEFYPLVLVTTSLLPVCAMLSDKIPIKNISFICTTLAVAVFIIICVLSIVDTEFSKPILVKPDFKNILPFLYFSVFDIVFLLCKSKNKTPLAYVFGGALAFGFYLVFILIAKSVLSYDVYISLEMPLLRLWQSTFITSFVNRFEVIAMSFVYLLCALKSGIILKFADCKNTFAIITAMLIIAALLSFL